jgi:hypothetical protein
MTAPGHATPLIKVDDVVLQYAMDDVTGAITGRWIGLTGPLKPI